MKKLIIIIAIVLFSFASYAQSGCLKHVVNYSDTTINKVFFVYGATIPNMFEKKFVITIAFYMSKQALMNGAIPITLPQIPNTFIIDGSLDGNKTWDQISDPQVYVKTALRNYIKAQIVGTVNGDFEWY